MKLNNHGLCSHNKDKGKTPSVNAGKTKTKLLEGSGFAHSSGQCSGVLSSLQVPEERQGLQAEPMKMSREAVGLAVAPA